MGNTIQQPRLLPTCLLAWQVEAEMGIVVPRCGGRAWGTWKFPAGMLSLTHGLPLTNPGLPWT